MNSLLPAALPTHFYLFCSHLCSFTMLLLSKNVALARDRHLRHHRTGTAVSKSFKHSLSWT